MLCAVSAAVLTFDSEEVFGAVKKGCALCADTIIPSVFPFLFLSLFIVKCGLAKAAGEILAPVTEKVFCLPGCAGAVIITSLVGGYPAGAQMAAQLCAENNISREQFEKLMCFCVCAGPAFLIQTIGRCFFGSGAAGFILLAAQTVSCLLLGIFACRAPVLGFKERFFIQTKRKNNPLSFSAEVFSDCAARSASAMLNICAYVVIFSVVGVILSKTGVAGLVSSVLYAITKNKEISAAFLPAVCDTASGSAAACRAGLLFASFALVFGGFCVHFQIFSFCAGLKLNKLRFFVFRVLAGLLSALITRLLLVFFPIVSTAAAQEQRQMSFSSVSRSGSAAVMVMCLAAVIMLPDMQNKIKSLDRQGFSN